MTAAAETGVVLRRRCYHTMHPSKLEAEHPCSLDQKCQMMSIAPSHMKPLVGRIAAGSALKLPLKA